MPRLVHKKPKQKWEKSHTAVKPMPKDLSLGKAYKLGRYHRQLGLGLKDNPWIMTDYGNAWRMGWHDQERMILEERGAEIVEGV